ncbi:MAG TPA: aminotransferase class IV [Terriglobia bacterium]|nr:aminotransferase class IV [Terriglobia bacterium]
MPELANVNGKVVPVNEAVVPAEDRGNLFGDGVYEVLRSYGGRLWGYARHWRRLERSLGEIDIRNADLKEIDRWVKQTYEQSQIADATVYFHITRGAAPRSHGWPEDMAPNFLMTVRPFVTRGHLNETGIHAITTPDQRWSRCDIKSLNLLPNVMAKQQARNRQAYEAILIDRENRVVEGTSCAVICLTNGKLCAPPNGSTGILPSITRRFVEEIARTLGLPFEERFVPAHEFLAAEEAFLAGTGDEIMGITHTDGKPIGNGRVGPWTRKIYEEYRSRIARGED